jgi:hypothetical protein
MRYGPLDAVNQMIVALNQHDHVCVHTIILLEHPGCSVTIKESTFGTRLTNQKSELAGENQKRQPYMIYIC